MTTGRILTGVERDRSFLRHQALKIIRQILDQPLPKLNDARKDWLAPPPLSAFRRLEPIGFGLTDDDYWIFSPALCTADVVWPLDVGAVLEGNDGLTLSRTYTVTAMQVRGYASRFSPFMVRTDIAQMCHGKFYTAAGLYAWLGGGWVDAQKGNSWHNNGIPNFRIEETSDREKPRLATGIALRQRYDWAVALGLEHAPSIRFVTDPTGIKDVFRIRDLPEGRDRRAALLTWVEDHWRQNRHDPDIEIYVRRHLRGTTQFTWSGMQGEILPSQFDIETKERLIAEREAKKIAGTDRRPSGAKA